MTGMAVSKNELLGEKVMDICTSMMRIEMQPKQFTDSERVIKRRGILAACFRRRST